MTTWKLNDKHLAAAKTALDALSDQIQDELEAEYEEHSDRWKDSERGEIVREWLDKVLDSVEALRDDLADLKRDAEPDL